MKVSANLLYSDSLEISVSDIILISFPLLNADEFSILLIYSLEEEEEHNWIFSADQMVDDPTGMA